MTELNERQRRFVEEHVRDGNATRAARDAGYSSRTAESQGSRLLRNVKVAAAIRHEQAKVSKRLEISTDMVLDAMWREANAGDLDAPNGARVQAQMGVAKIMGMLVDRSEVGTPGDFTGLSDEELRERVAAKLKQIERNSR